MSETPVEAVVFDLDGLIFNTEELYVDVGGELLRRRGFRYEEDLIDQMMGRPSRVALQIMIDHHGLSDTIEQLQHETDEIFAGLLDSRLATMPGFDRLLQTLEQAGLPRAIGTSSRRGFVQNVLGRFNLAPRFAFVLTSEDVTNGKPHPEIYLTAAARLGAAPERTMVLEDSSNGLQAAVAAGTFAVAVPGHHSRHHDFPGARFIADSLADPRIYAAIGAGNPS